MKKTLLLKEGNLYKANLHCHTTESDGKFTPEEIKKMYQNKGYSAVAYTDHRKCVPHTDLTDESFVALTGIEIARESCIVLLQALTFPTIPWMTRIK